MEVITVRDAPGFERFRDWLRRGYHGSMAYLQDREEAYQNPKSILSQTKTIVMLAIPYTPATSLRKRTTDADSSQSDETTPGGFGKVAAYASGEKDYHDVIHTRLKSLKKWVQENSSCSVARGVVDTAPILERDFAAAAGLGWIGKNTLLLRRDAGSYFFLAAILTDIIFEGSNQDTQPQVTATDHCGTCTACLDACPTQAFTQPRVLDATKCISYLTIEHRGSIDIELREKMGSWILGCDVCQQVCPWNRMAVSPSVPELAAIPMMQSIDLIELLQMTEEAFRSKYRETPLWRPKLRGMQRNAMISLANQNYRPAIEAIRPFLKSEDMILRETAIWAIERLVGFPG